jgi:alanine racemase
VGDEVVLIGRQGDESVSAAEWARLLGTIGYEVVCAISARIARHHGPST